jgi:predicted TIM-barrel fold metal-dependent hydrolase
MWATDWPIVEDWSTYARALGVVRDEMKFFSAEDLRWVLAETVERVWRFGA